MSLAGARNWAAVAEPAMAMEAKTDDEVGIVATKRMSSLERMNDKTVRGTVTSDGAATSLYRRSMELHPDRSGHCLIYHGP